MNEFDYQTVEDGYAPAYVIYDLKGRYIPPWNVIAVLNKMPAEFQIAITKLQDHTPEKKVNNV